MNARIQDKRKEIETYLSELAIIKPVSLEEYKLDLKTKAACERYAEKIIEAVVDLSFLIIKEKGGHMPEDDKQIFDILFQNNVIAQQLAEKLKDAKGMRNIIAHEYGSIDDEIIFLAITEELEHDVQEFLRIIKKLK